MDEEFYQRQYFDQLTLQIGVLQQDLKQVREDVSDIKSKVVYMYGFAAGIGIFASIIIDWFRTKFFGAH